MSMWGQADSNSQHNFVIARAQQIHICHHLSRRRTPELFARSVVEQGVLLFPGHSFHV